jgi:hypothetical protein
MDNSAWQGPRHYGIAGPGAKVQTATTHPRPMEEIFLVDPAFFLELPMTRHIFVGLVETNLLKIVAQLCSPFATYTRWACNFESNTVLAKKYGITMTSVRREQAHATIYH